MMSGPGLVLVVGATGNIGAAVVAELVGLGVPVRAMVRNEPAAGRFADGVEVAVGDLARPDTVRPVFDRVERVFLVTSDPTLESVAVEAAAGAGVGLVVKSSAMGPGGRPPAGHAASEAYLAASGIDWVVLRPNAFMQTLAQYLPLVLDTQGHLTLPAGNGRTGWVDTGDIAAAAAAILTDPSPLTATIRTITGPASLSMHDVARDLADATGKHITYQPLEPTGTVAQFERNGMPTGMANFLAAHYTAVRAGDFDVVTDDVAALCGRPARSWRTFLVDHPTLL